MWLFPILNFLGSSTQVPPPRHLIGKVQDGAYRAFKINEICADFPWELTLKLVTTLGDEVSNSTLVPDDWVIKLTHVLEQCKTQVAICVFKTLIGGWTTSHCMHEQTKLPCIFGCFGETDSLNHYFLCFPLWHVCSSMLGVEAPWSLSDRLGITSPSPERLRLLALVFLVYHNAKSRAKELGGYVSVGANRVQQIASDSAREFLFHV